MILFIGTEKLRIFQYPFMFFKTNSPQTRKNRNPFQSDKENPPETWLTLELAPDLFSPKTVEIIIKNKERKGCLLLVFSMGAPS